MKYDVIIPCLNEASTIGAIVRAFKEVKSIGIVYVMNDTLTQDDTMKQAVRAGAHVIQSNRHGKGQLVTRGLQLAKTDRVILCDGDYQDFSCHAIHHLLMTRQDSMGIGVPRIPTFAEWNDHGLSNTFDVAAWAMMSGFRVIPRDLISEAHGYLLETLLNKAVQAKGIQYELHQCQFTAPLRFNRTRLMAMEEDRLWGLKNGVFDA